MILAAGFGTRLGALSQRRPKPMLPVCGIPLVRWAVLWLRHHGIREIVVNLHHLGELIEAELKDGSELGVTITYSREDGMILGTGGGLRRARPLLDDGHGTPIVVVNGKILFDLDLAEVLAQHHRNAAEATMVLRPDPDAGTWGSFRLDGEGRIVEFLQASPASGGAPPISERLMFTGVHVFQPAFLDRVPAEGEQCIIRTAYRGLFHEGRGLYGFESRDYWWEHSTPERYLRGVTQVLSGAAQLPFAPQGTTGIHPTAAIAATAQIRPPVWIDADVHVGPDARIGPRTQLGAGCRIEAGVEITDSVVWEGLTVGRDLHGELYTGE